MTLQPYQKELLKVIMNLRPGDKIINVTRRRRPDTSPRLKVSAKRLLVFFLCLLTITTHAAELWRGTLHLSDTKRLTGVIEQVTATHLRFVAQGTAYSFKIADLPAATRGEIFSNATPEEKAAYQADLARRRVLAAAKAEKARAAQNLTASAARIETRVAEMEADQRAQKQAALEAHRLRAEEQRRTQALEQIALELQLRRLSGGR